jgi:membrane fusion protein (multidrug efflux system)
VNFTFTDGELRQLQEIDKSAEELFDSKNVKVELQFGDGAGLPAYRHGRHALAHRRCAHRHHPDARHLPQHATARLLPGQFVRVKMTGIVMPNAIVIPKIAVSQGPLGPFVYLDREGQRGARPARCASTANCPTATSCARAWRRATASWSTA